MGVTWTEEQQKVISLRDRNILVSAAAGSGKRKPAGKSTGQDFFGRDTGDSGGKGAEADLYAVFSEHDPDGDRP